MTPEPALLRMEERVAPTLLDDARLHGPEGGDPSALAAARREAMHKGRPPNPGLPDQGCISGPTVDDGVAPRLGPHGFS